MPRVFKGKLAQQVFRVIQGQLVLQVLKEILAQLVLQALRGQPGQVQQALKDPQDLKVLQELVQ